MYPFIRMINAIRKAKKQSRISLFEKQTVSIRVYPWDLDIFNELNNGRALTLYDLGRFSLSVRSGLDKVLKHQKLGLTVAGSFVRYRSRVRAWQKIDITAQCVGVDDKFFYMLQNMYRNGEPVGQVLLRAALTRKKIVPPQELIDLLQISASDVPKLPQWVKDLATADSGRPWPPEE